MRALQGNASPGDFSPATTQELTAWDGSDRDQVMH